MSVPFPPLPYATDALQPYLSASTLSIHYGKHHRHYVSALNEKIDGTSYDEMNLDDIVFNSAINNDQQVFNNAAQAWNHAFYWNCMTPKKNLSPDEACLAFITRNFASMDDLKSKFIGSAARLFGSGWTWLVRNPNDTLKVINTPNAATPMVNGLVPLLACDVWEHAYYLDYQNERERYLEHFWQLINWNFVSDQILKPLPRNSNPSIPAKHPNYITMKPFQENTFD